MSDHFRTPHAADHYRKVRAERAGDTSCALCMVEPLAEYTHWKVMQNAFPYDVIAERHDMLVPRRHANEHEFTAEEQEELVRLKKELGEEYGYFLEVSSRGRSIPDHFHLHLIVARTLEGSDAASSAHSDRSISA